MQHSIRPTFLVCINHVWFTLDQQVLLPISCTESSRANLTDTGSHARNVIHYNNLAISRLFLIPISTEVLPKCRRKRMWCILRNIRRRIAKKLLGIYYNVFIQELLLVSHIKTNVSQLIRYF